MPQERMNRDRIKFKSPSCDGMAIINMVPANSDLHLHNDPPANTNGIEKYTPATLHAVTDDCDPPEVTYSPKHNVKTPNRNSKNEKMRLQGSIPRDDTINFTHPTLNKEVQTEDFNVNIEKECERNKSEDEDEEEEDEEIGEQNFCMKKVAVVHHSCLDCWSKNRKYFVTSFGITCLLLYLAFLIYAIYYSPVGSIGLIVITVLVILWKLCPIIWEKKGEDIQKYCCNPMKKRCDKVQRYLKWILYITIGSAFLVFIAVDVRHDTRRLTSLGGLLILVLLSFITSNNPSRVKWRPVIWGLLLQFLMGLVVLRWEAGFKSVKYIADLIEGFLGFSRKGAEFVFGDLFKNHPFAFESMPVVIYFSSIISMLYYWGIMQRIIKIMASVMQFTMGTTALESLACASNIFVSYVEVAPILIPYFHKLTRSEIHAILCSGFASVAGSVMVIYMSFKAPAVHLISACLMSAPAALAVAKLTYPETKKSRTKHPKDVEITNVTPERNAMEAAANGAMNAIKLVAGICACLIAFMGIIGFVNATLAWLGSRIGKPELSFQYLSSYLFWPLTIVMGIDVEDAGKVAAMIGLKIFVDDILCYKDLGDAIGLGLIKNERSKVIATYACCGFGSLGALGVALGTMMAIASPNKRHAVTELMWRALVNGNVAAFMTACVAGILYQDNQVGGIGAALNMTQSN